MTSDTGGNPRTLGELAAAKLEELKRIIEMMDAEYDLAMANGRDLQKQLDAMRGNAPMLTGERLYYVSAIRLE